MLQHYTMPLYRLPLPFSFNRMPRYYAAAELCAAPFSSPFALLLLRAVAATLNFRGIAISNMPRSPTLPGLPSLCGGASASYSA